MIVPVNPHNALPFYLGNPDRAQRGYLHCPTASAPHWQFYVSGAAQTVTDYEFLNTMTGAAIAVDTALVAVDDVGAGAFYTYLGGGFATAMTAGATYQLRVTLSGGGVYYSHALCPAEAWDASLMSLSVTSCSNPVSGQYTFNFALSIPIGVGYQINVSDDNSDASFWAMRVFSFTQTFGEAVTGAKSISINAKATYALPNGGETTVTKRYRLIFQVADPCGTYSLTEEDSTSTFAESMFLLEIDSDGNDRPSLTQMYQTGFKQQFYFVGFDGLPSPITEENYATTPDGALAFQGANVRQQYRYDFYPLVDELLSAFQSLRYVSGASLKYLGGTAKDVERFTVTAASQDNTNLSVGTLAVEFGSTRVPTCETDYIIE